LPAALASLPEQDFAVSALAEEQEEAEDFFEQHEAALAGLAISFTSAAGTGSVMTIPSVRVALLWANVEATEHIVINAPNRMIFFMDMIFYNFSNYKFNHLNPSLQVQSLYSLQNQYGKCNSNPIRLTFGS
jgi:hypothetical protein